MKNAISKSNLNLSDIDYFEVNEAFSLTALLTSMNMNIPLEKINVNGGAVSLGHPVGMSGARILLSMINTLRTKGGKYGCVGICNGGGGATSVVIKNMQ